MTWVAEVLPVDMLAHKALVAVLLWLAMIAATLIDLWTGIEAAKARRDYIQSGGLRRTVSKIGDYWRVLAMLFIIDLIGGLMPWWNLPYTSMLGTVSIIAIEGKSVLENLRAKRSPAVGIPEMARRIIHCKDAASASALVQELLSIARLAAPDAADRPEADAAGFADPKKGGC